MKDVLFLTQYFYPEYVSSAVLPFETAQKLNEAGFQVGALCGYPYEYNDDRTIPVRENKDGIEIHRVKYLALARKGTIGRLLNFITFFLSVFFHLREAKQYKSIIVYSDPPILPLIAWWAHKRYGTKVVFVCYDIYPEIGINTGNFSKGGLVDRLFGWINRKVYQNLDMAVALSTDMKEYLLSHRDISENHISIIHNWGNDKANTDFEKVSFPEIPDDAFVISYLGNMGVCQDAATLIEAMIQLKEESTVHFIVAGHGSKMPEIKEAIREHGLNQVHFYDFLHGKDYELALKRSNAFIVSLVEGMTGLCSPSKACNYLLMGKPVCFIGEQSIELAEQIVNGDCGFCIRNGEAKTLADKIEEMKHNPEKTEKMGANARVLYQEYSKANCLQQYVMLFKSLLRD